MTYDEGGANVPIRRHSEGYDSARTSRRHGIKLKRVRNVGSAKQQKYQGGVGVRRIGL